MIHMDTSIQKNNISFFIEKIKNGEPFRFLRFGDGEWYVVKGDKKDIAKGEHSVFPEITEDLRYIVSNLNIFHYNGLQGLSLTLPHLSILIPEWYNWCDSDIFHKASLAGKLYPFIEALKDKYIVIVGNENLKKIKRVIEYKDFITVRDHNCYLDKKMVLEKMKKYPSGTIFLFCASRLSVPAIYHSDRDDCTMIDLGSLFEPYLGKSTRRYHHLMTKEIINKNIGK